MNSPMVFSCEEFGEIRTLNIDGEPWFIGKEIAEILGYENGSRDINRHVDPNDKKVLKSQNYQNGTFEIPNRGLTVINESGLYSLILSSKLPSAKKFSRWVTAEVLPSLRKNGAYMTAETLHKAIPFSYMSNELLTTGNTVASIDEFYLFLTNLTAVEYIRNFMKRVRKKESAVILASQNIEDFLVENVRELTKPLFSIPTHHFLFNAGTIDSKFYMDALQLEPSEFSLIRYPQRGVCLYKCGNERYCLCVHAPEHKERLFGSAGGR